MPSPLRSIASLGVVLLLACSKPKPVEVKPVAARVASVGTAGVGLLLDLEVRNPNSFEINARSVEGTLLIGDGVEIGRGSAAPGTRIPAEGTARVPAELTLSTSNLAALAPYALSDRPVPYRFTGVAKLEGKLIDTTLPFTLTGQLTRSELLSLGLRSATGAHAP
jgi:LEA14-like dessication related protein